MKRFKEMSRGNYFWNVHVVVPISTILHEYCKKKFKELVMLSFSSESLGFIRVMLLLNAVFQEINETLPKQLSESCLDINRRCCQTCCLALWAYDEKWIYSSDFVHRPSARRHNHSRIRIFHHF